MVFYGVVFSIGAAEAVSFTLLGLRNDLDPGINLSIYIYILSYLLLLLICIFLSIYLGNAGIKDDEEDMWNIDHAALEDQWVANKNRNNSLRNN
jgi:hypothetical protein